MITCFWHSLPDPSGQPLASTSNREEHPGVCASYLRHMPDDGVPFYDYADPRIPGVPRDGCRAYMGGLLSARGACSMAGALRPPTGQS